MRVRSWLGVRAAALGLALGLSACAEAPTPGEVVIGLVYPLSGPTATAGRDVQHALMLVADMVNGVESMPPGAFYQRLRGLVGLPGGARLRLVAVDHRGRLEIGQAEVERLVAREHVHALLGAYASDVTAATSEVAERLGVPYVAPEAGAPKLTRRGLRSFFRTAPHEEHLSQAVFDFLADAQRRPGGALRTVALVREDTPSRAETAAVQRRMAQKYGYRVVADLAFRPGTAAQAAPARPRGAGDPDVWLLAASLPDASLLAEAALAHGWHPRLVVAQDAGDGVPAASPEPAGGEGLLAPVPASADRLDPGPVTRAFEAGYRARAGRDLYELPAQAIVGLVTLLDAITRARSTEPAAIRAALVRTQIRPAELPVAWTGVRFDETGQNVGVRAVVVQRQGGAYRTVWPSALATRDVLHPSPARSSRP